MASVTRLDNGHYKARYRTPDGKSRSQTFPLRRDAVRFLSDMESGKNRGMFVDPVRSKATVGLWADQWLTTKMDVTPKTRERYAGIIRAHIRPRWGDVRLGDVEHAQVQKWVSGLDMEPATVVKVHRVFSQILKYAVHDGRLGRNPAEGVTLPRVHAAEKRYLSHAQVDQLADLCGPYRLTVLFLAYTGVRWGEMAALRVGRVDFLRRRASIRESVTPTSGGLVWGATKGHEAREVPLPPFLVDELAALVDGKGRDDLVFTAPLGGVMRAQQFQRQALNAAAESMGLATATEGTDGDGKPVVVWSDHLHPHELRHTSASLAIASGADVKVVQTMLGHKSATLTLDLYGHLFGDRLDVVSTAMDTARTAELGNPVSDPCPIGKVVRMPNRA